MKRFLCILGAITFVLLDLGILFKLAHWPGGAVILLVTLVILIPVFIICMAIHLAKRG